jgi:hypothetical protein
MVRNKNIITMKNTHLLLLGLVLIASQCKNRKPKPGEVTLLITTSQQYCGGAAPDEAILAELATPKPLNKDTVFLQSVDKPDSEIVPLVTSSKGIVTVPLPEGNYTLYLHYPEDQFTDLNTLSEKKRCEVSWKSMFAEPFMMDPSVTSMEFNFFITCNPCEEPRP